MNTNLALKLEIAEFERYKENGRLLKQEFLRLYAKDATEGENGPVRPCVFVPKVMRLLGEIDSAVEDYFRARKQS